MATESISKISQELKNLQKICSEQEKPFLEKERNLQSQIGALNLQNEIQRRLNEEHRQLNE